MSAPRSKKHRLRKVLTAFVVLLAAYFLAWGPVAGLYRTGRLPLPAPQWLSTALVPLYFLSDSTPLQAPLEAYAAWWTKTLHRS